MYVPKHRAKTLLIIITTAMLALICFTNFVSSVQDGSQIVGKWERDDKISAGLPVGTTNVRDAMCAAFNVTGDNTWTAYFMGGASFPDDKGFAMAYYWDGDSWVRDDTRVAGIVSDVLPPQAHGDVAYNVTGDGNWTLIVGSQYGTFAGYYWNGSHWVENSDYVLGLPDIGDWATAELDFNLTGSNQWTLFAGEEIGIVNGFFWNGSQWVSNATLVNGLDDVGAYSDPTLGYDVFNDGKWTMIVARDGGYIKPFSYYWNGTQWIRDDDRGRGLTTRTQAQSLAYLVFNHTGDGLWHIFYGGDTVIPDGWTWRWGFYIRVTTVDSAMRKAETTVKFYNGTWFTRDTANGQTSFLTRSLEVQLAVYFQDVLVNTTSINMTDDTTVSLTCLIYKLTVKVIGPGGQPVPGVELELLRNETLLNGKYGLPESPVTNASGMFTWEQLAIQRTSYTVVVHGVGSQTTTLTEDTTLTFTVIPRPPPTKPPAPPPAPPTVREAVQPLVTAWEQLPPSGKVAVAAVSFVGVYFIARRLIALLKE